MWIRALVATAMVLSVAAAAAAQNWPGGKPVTVIIPFSAGSAVDIIARTLFEQIDKQAGSTSIIEPRPGAGGTTAAGVVAKAAPDGHTILFASSAHTITALVYKKLGYDAEKDFAPVTTVATLPNVLVASPNKGYKTVHDLVAAAKARPGALNYVTVGPATASHLNSERFARSAGFKAQAIPFKGSPEGLTEVMTGRADFYFVPLLPALPLIRDGRVVALAVSSTTRAKELPEVPTTVEAGYPNSEYLFWFGVLLPAKTPAAIVDRLHDEIVKALAVPAVRERLAKLGAEPLLMAPPEFGALVHKELQDNAELLKAAGITVN
jgi:tripartite-type tricarboxylate transporter receptor subunit TctC